MDKQLSMDDDDSLCEKFVTVEGEVDGLVFVDVRGEGICQPEDEIDRNVCMENQQAINGSHVYVEEWNKLFNCPNYTMVLRNHAFEGDLRSCRFRSVCWKVFLSCLPKEKEKWIEATNSLHQHYETLKSNFIINPRIANGALDPLVNNPLSQEEASPWNQYFQDSELKLTIQQDVIRTFPEVEFFHSSEIQTLMVNILFCYARENPQTCYRQGMHELLAPLIFVLHSDQQAYLHATEMEFIEETVKVVLDPTYLEHDAYFMFLHLMDNVESWYHIRELNPSKFSLNEKPFPRPQDINAYTAVISKLNYIHDFLMRKHDHELYSHLEKMEIAPQIFGIRWLRLLFGREFALQDLLVIWDVIFADEKNFNLVDYIFVSMLSYLKFSLLNSDYATCLGYLMRYPAIADVHYIIDYALHIREPLKYKKPKGHNAHQFQPIPTVGGRIEIHRAPVTSRQSLSESKDQTKGINKVMSGFSTLTRKMSASRPTSLGVSSASQIQPSVRPKETSKSSSEPNSITSQSPSPDLAEYAHIEIDCENAEKTAVGSTSNLLLSSDTETELQPLGAKFYDSRASTLPRPHVVNNTGGRRESLKDVELNRMRIPSQRGKGVIFGEEASEMTRHGSLKSYGGRKGFSLFDKTESVRHDVAYLQGRLNDLESMCMYCSQKMTNHIDRLQECILKQTLENEDEMLIALAGMKQVRDILKGTLKFSQNILDGDDIVISDNHYPKDRIDPQS